MANEDWGEALRRIEDALETQATTLNLNELAIDHVPSEIRALTSLKVLWLRESKVQNIAAVAHVPDLEELALTMTPVADLSPIVHLKHLARVDLRATQINDLRPLLKLPLLSGSKPEGIRREVLCHSLESQLAPELARVVAESWVGDEDDITRLMEYLRTLPPWPEPLTGGTVTTSEKHSKAYRRLTMSTARTILEEDYPLVKDRCEAVIHHVEEGLAYHRMRIPNDRYALEDHKQVEDALTFAKALAVSVYGALPDDFTDRPQTDEAVDRFRDAMNSMVAKLEDAGRYIDRPDHSPTYGGIMRLGVATSLGGLVALFPSISIAAAIPIIYSSLYGKEATKAALGVLKQTKGSEGSWPILAASHPAARFGAKSST